MKKNIGELDAYIRLTGGLTMLGVGIVKKSTPMIIFGASKVAEGITKFCPILHLLGLSTNNDNNVVLKFSKEFDAD